MRVRNWEQFQHYKDRCPPWIKLHFELLTSRDWVMLDDASRVLAIACMLIASRYEGKIPEDPAYVQRVAYLHKKPNFKPLIDCGFLELDGGASGCKQMLADARPETETETETETEVETEAEERKKRARTKFTPPSVDEVEEYRREKGYRIDPEHFIAYYESQGWKKANGQPVTSWKGCVVTFAKREEERRATSGDALYTGMR